MLLRKELDVELGFIIAIVVGKFGNSGGVFFVVECYVGEFILNMGIYRLRRGGNVAKIDICDLGDYLPLNGYSAGGCKYLVLKNFISESCHHARQAFDIAV